VAKYRDVEWQNIGMWSGKIYSYNFAYGIELNKKIFLAVISNLKCIN
jgi:hypothetical protein